MYQTNILHLNLLIEKIWNSQHKVANFGEKNYTVFILY